MNVELRDLRLIVALGLSLIWIMGCSSSSDDEDFVATNYTITATIDGTAAVGQNTMMIDVKLDGVPVVGAKITVDPQMPHHGHGSSETPVVTEMGNGSYKAFPVTLQMAGKWTITVTVEEGKKRGSSQIQVEVN